MIHLLPRDIAALEFICCNLRATDREEVFANRWNDDPFALAVWVFEDLSDVRPVTTNLTPREREIAQFLSGNVCTRVGPRGQQRQVHAQQIEVARIRHFTSRAGDPHRHIHLQLNARVPASGRWRGIDSAAVLRIQNG